MLVEELLRDDQEGLQALREKNDQDAETQMSEAAMRHAETLASNPR